LGVSEIYGRSDYAIIGELIEPGTRVLDLGCGEGELLAWLAAHKGVDARGVEINGARVQRAIARNPGPLSDHALTELYALLLPLCTAEARRLGEETPA